MFDPQWGAGLYLLVVVGWFLFVRFFFKLESTLKKKSAHIQMYSFSQLSVQSDSAGLCSS